MCQNIDDFNRGCALIMARLYQNFPRRVHFRVNELDAGLDIPEDLRAELLRERLAVYSATVEFLSEEGFLSYGSHAGGESERMFANARLTSKGLAALNRTPSALKQKTQTVGDALVSFGRDMLAEGAREIVKQSVSTILGG